MSSQSNDNSSIRDGQKQPPNEREESDPVNGRNGGGGGGGGGTVPLRTHSTESLGWPNTDAETNGSDAPETAPPSTGESVPVNEYAYGLPLYTEYFRKYNYNVEDLRFVRINNITIDRSPADGGPGDDLSDSHPYPPDSGLLVGMLAMHNQQRRTLLVSRLALAKGYLGAVTTFEALYQVGFTALNLHSDPGLVTITSMAQAVAAQSPVLVRMILHDEKLLAELKKMAYPFPMASSFKVIKLPGYDRSDEQDGPSNGPSNGPNARK